MTTRDILNLHNHLKIKYDKQPPNSKTTKQQSIYFEVIVEMAKSRGMILPGSLGWFARLDTAMDYGSQHMSINFED